MPNEISEGQLVKALATRFMAEAAERGVTLDELHVREYVTAGLVIREHGGNALVVRLARDIVSAFDTLLARKGLAALPPEEWEKHFDEDRLLIRRTYTN